MKIFITLFFLGAVILTGCSQNNAESTYDRKEDKNGKNLLTSHDGMRGDGDFVNENTMDRTMSSQNPNLPNTDGTRNSFSADVQQARDVISAKGFVPGRIWINGGNMSVTALDNRQLTEKERAKAEDSLEKRLTKALPRYKIRVQIKND